LENTLSSIKDHDGENSKNLNKLTEKAAVLKVDVETSNKEYKVYIPEVNNFQKI